MVGLIEHLVCRPRHKRSEGLTFEDTWSMLTVTLSHCIIPRWILYAGENKSLFYARVVSSVFYSQLRWNKIRLASGHNFLPRTFANMLYPIMRYFVTFFLGGEGRGGLGHALLAMKGGCCLIYWLYKDTSKGLLILS